MRIDRRLAFLLILALGACSSPPAPTPVATTGAPVPVASPTSEPTGSPTPLAPTPSPIAFRIDVANLSHVPAVFSLATDLAADMRGFQPGEAGSMVIALGSASNGIGVEVLGPTIGCGYLAKQILPTTAPLTLRLTDGPTANTVKLSVTSGVEQSPRPLPTNGLVCPGG
jgi:hypothetical protein